MNTKHLDLGCGTKPRNPYNAKNVYGVDIRPGTCDSQFTIVSADLVQEPIPFKDNYFDSISAYDFLEHIPRVTIINGKTKFPFIELMNEIWRVLKHDGKFYASTPAYPHPAAFQDPTHVNIITRETHQYFVGKDPTSRMYGFNGGFSIIRIKPTRGGVFDYLPWKQEGWIDKFKEKRREKRNTNSHVIWELKAIKQ